MNPSELPPVEPADSPESDSPPESPESDVRKFDFERVKETFERTEDTYKLATFQYQGETFQVHVTSFKPLEAAPKKAGCTLDVYNSRGQALARVRGFVTDIVDIQVVYVNSLLENRGHQHHVPKIKPEDYVEVPYVRGLLKQAIFELIKGGAFDTWYSAPQQQHMLGGTMLNIGLMEMIQDSELADRIEVRDNDKSLDERPRYRFRWLDEE